MDITSFVFYVFAGISLLVYWKFQQKYQWLWLLLVSLLFYCANVNPVTLIYVLCSVVSVYLAVNYFSKVDTKYNDKDNSIIESKKKRAMVLTLLFNVAILAILKYTNLAIHTFNFALGGGTHGYLREVHWLAPLAISFYTLQLVSYLLDCYWGIAEPEKNIGKLLLYTIYFPQMVSGPISRRSQLGGQLFEKHEFDYNRVVHGLKRIAWGLMKKLAISNRIAVVVDAMWADPVTYSGFYIWIAAAAFMIQLYTDFSGCMDIVLGVSECFGIYLPENFYAPLLSKTTQEFWQRWHITLGQWLRDYIMNPITKSDWMVELGSRCKKRFGKKKGRKIPVYLSMLVLWLAMGLWHGDSWKYILGEGLWFWLVITSGQILEPCFVRWKTKLHIRDKSVPWQCFQVVRTFVIVTIGNLFFRADSLMDALHRIAVSFRFHRDFGVFMEFAHLCASNDLGGKFGFGVAVIAFVLMAAVDFCKYYHWEVCFQFFERHVVLKWIGYYAIVTILVLSLDIGVQEFAYAQF